MNAKIKVFLVLECGSPHGVGHQVATISRNLDRERFDPWVVYGVRPGSTQEEFERMTSSAAHRVHIPEMVRPISPLKDLTAFWKLYRLMRREKPDVVHAESSKAGVLARSAAWLAGVPCIYYSPHGYSFLQTDVWPLGRTLYWWIEKSFSGIGSIIVCSQGEEALARKLSWGREVHLVRNIFLREGPPPAPAANPGEVVIGTLARLAPSKNPEAFLRMAEALAKDHPNARFIWMGGGELEEKFRRQVARSGLEGRFEVTGHIPSESVPERIAGLDIFVYYSLWEGGAPIALHEALYCAKPAVVSNIAGNADLVIPGVTGFLASDESELLSHVSRLVESADLRTELGRNGKSFLERDISPKNSISELERLYSRGPNRPSPADKIKIFLILECGSPHGVGRQVATLSQHLDRKRFDPWVVYAVRPGSTPEEFERMTRFASHRVHIPEMVRPISPLKDLVAFWKLYWLIRREKPDVIHAESSKAGVLARAAAWLAGVPRVYYSPHGYSFLQTDVGPLGRTLYWWLEKVFSGIGNIIVCSPGEEKLARELSWGRPVFQVRNLFVMEDPPPRAAAAKGGAIVVGALGRLTHARNPQAFLRLAEGVSRAHPNARFVWMGGGELEEDFRSRVARSGLQDRFEVTGHVSRENVLEKLAALDIFVHYSRWEGGAPIALHEALYFAKAVVVSNIAGNVDLVVPGVTGLLASNEEELLRHVNRLVECADLRAELGRNGKAFLDREVSLAKSIAKLERLYGK